MNLSDLDRRRTLAAIAAWYAPSRVPEFDQDDVADMFTALAEPSAEAALVRWAYKKVPTDPAGPLPPDDVRAMERARAAAGRVTHG